MSGTGTIRVYRPDPAAIGQTERCGRATFSTQLLPPALLVVTVDGDVDAINGRALGRFVERHTAVSRQLILDLSHLDFFGAQGFTALHYVSVSCARDEVDWVIAAGREARRLLRICDPDGVLPVETTRERALTTLRRQTHGRYPLTAHANSA